MQKQKYTQAELEAANSIDLVALLQKQGEKLVRVGREHKWVYNDASGTHDSIMICGSKWYDHKNQTGGGAIKFVQEQFNMDFIEAVQFLIGDARDIVEINQKKPIYIPPPKELKVFKLPDANSDMRRVFAYLTKERYIDPEIISHFAHEKKLYEEKNYHNAVFVGYDENGEPKQAHLRSSTTFGKPFRITLDGSDTRYCFNHIGSSNRLYVFEAPIDMMSFLSLYKKDWQQNSYIALNGVYENSMLHTLENYKSLDEIYLCVDNDEGGIEAIDRLRDILHEKDYLNVYRIAPEMKDWNECLKARYGVEALPAVPHKRKEQYISLAENLHPVQINMDKLSSVLWSMYKQEQYFKLTEAALSASVILLKRVKPDNDFNKLRGYLASSYKPYTDRSKMRVKQDNLGKAMQDLMKDLKQNNIRTALQMNETARLLFVTADYALRCETENKLTQSLQTGLSPPEQRMELTI